MTGIEEKKLLYGISYDETDELFLPKLYTNIVAARNHVEVPESLRIAFDKDNPHIKAISDLADYKCFFQNCSSLFLNPHEAHVVLNDMEGTESEVGINLIAIRQAIGNNIDERADYERYKEILRTYGCIDKGVSSELFERLKSAMLYLPLDENNREIYGVIDGVSDERAKAASIAIKDTLRMPEREQVPFLYYTLETCKRIRPQGRRKSYNEEELIGIAREILSQVNSIPKSRKENKKFLLRVANCVSNIVAAENPLAVLQGLELYKKTENYTGGVCEDGSYVSYRCPGDDFQKNNILLECGMLFDEVEKIVYLKENEIENRKLAIIAPSYSFISKWIRKGEDNSVTFVIADEKAKCILMDACSGYEKISFASMAKYIETTVPDDGEIIICSNVEALNAEDIYHITGRKKRNKDSIIIALDTDSSFNNSALLVSAEIDSIYRLLLFPSGLGEGTKGKCNLWISDNRRHSRLKICSLLKKSTRELVLRRIANRIFLKSDLFPLGEETLRSRIIEIGKGSSGKSRTHNEPFQFTENLQIKYSGFSELALIDEPITAVFSFKIRKEIIEKKKEDKSSVKPKIRRKKKSTDNKKEEGKTERKYKFVTVKETRVDHTCHSIDEAYKYLTEEYFLETKEEKSLTDSSKTTVSLGDILRSKIRELRNKNIIISDPNTLRDFVCLFSTEIKGHMGDKEWSALLYLVLKSRISSYTLAEITPEVFCDALDEEFSTDEDSQLRALSAIYVVLNIAVNKHILPRNVFEENFEDGREWKNKYLHVRRLVKKTFTYQEFKFICGFVIHELKRAIGKSEDADTKAMWFSMLISLLTGLEANIVNAVKWKNLRGYDNYGFYILEVDRQLTNDGNYEKVLKDNDCRLLPLGRTLSKLLLNLRKKVSEIAVKNGKDEDYVGNNCYVSKAFSSVLNMMVSPLPPKKVAPEVKKLLSDILKIKDELVFVPDYDGGTKEVNLSSYGGDFFRENFKHYATDIAKFSEDELAYYVGNMRSTTAGIHYIDYKNEAMLIRLNTKLNRISSFLSADNREEKDSNGEVTFIRSEKPNALDIYFDEFSEGKLTIAVKHGFKYKLENNYAN